MRQRIAYQNLWTELGIEVAKIPEGHLVDEAFERLCGDKGLSSEAETAMLYRLVAMQYLTVFTIMIQAGEMTLEPRNVVFVTKIVDASVSWSERAQDRFRLESIASHLNKSIEKAFQSLGVQRGGERKDAAVVEDRSMYLRREVERCVRASSDLKRSFRLDRLSGFFEKLKKESQIRRWSDALELEYQQSVRNSPELWDVRLDNRSRTMEVLWNKFGLGSAHHGEAVYAVDVAAQCLVTWSACLWPEARLSKSDVVDEIERFAIRNSQAYESAAAKGIRMVLQLPVDQFVRHLSDELGPYA